MRKKRNKTKAEDIKGDHTIAACTTLDGEKARAKMVARHGEAGVPCEANTGSSKIGGEKT